MSNLSAQSQNRADLENLIKIYAADAVNAARKVISASNFANCRQDKYNLSSVSDADWEIPIQG